MSESHLSQEILEDIKTMALADQQMRSSGSIDGDQDRRRTERVKSIFFRYGWPDRSVVGEEVVQAFWLLVQHADHDVSFQETALQALRDAVKHGEADPRDEAFLTDRVRVNRGYAQLFGTQCYINEQGIFGPRPIEDIDHLDERRACIGLEPFVIYLKRLEEWQIPIFTTGIPRLFRVFSFLSTRQSLV